MNLFDSLNRFVDSTTSEYMPDAASRLLELLEADEVEPLKSPGAAVSAEDVADRLETRLRRLGRGGDGIEAVEDAVAHLRAADGLRVRPWTFEDGDGVRWFVLADEEHDIVACYTSAPFTEAEV
ncbi:MAG: hypothetical protein ACFB9M_11030 [Myxococcota bacterium]